MAQININSVLGGSWKLQATSPQTVSNVDVANSDASLGSLITANTSTDSGNNINWDFGVNNGSGSLSSQKPTMSGVGVYTDVMYGSGSLQSQAPSMSGSGLSTHIGSGALTPPAALVLSINIKGRSIGTKSDFTTGGTISINWRTVTLSGGTFDSRIVEGDALTIDSTETCYVRSRDSDTQLTLQYEPTLYDGQSGLSYGLARAYTSIATWEAGCASSLVALNIIEKGVCCDDGTTFTDDVTCTGVTVDQYRYRWLTVAPGHRHGGDKTKGANSTGTLYVYAERYFRLEYLRFHRETTYTGNINMVRFQWSSNHVRVYAVISRVMVHDVHATGSINGIQTWATGECRFYNCLVFNLYTHGAANVQNHAYYSGATPSGSHNYLYNCTAYNIGSDTLSTSGHRGFGATLNWFRNCISITRLSYPFPGSTYHDWSSGANDINCSNNASLEPLVAFYYAPGVNCVREQTPYQTFVNNTPGYEDLRVQSDSPCVNGIYVYDPEIDVQFDIADVDRGSGPTWVMGAYATTSSAVRMGFGALTSQAPLMEGVGSSFPTHSGSGELTSAAPEMYGYGMDSTAGTGELESQVPHLELGEGLATHIGSGSLIPPHPEMDADIDIPGVGVLLSQAPYLFGGRGLAGLSRHCHVSVGRSTEDFKTGSPKITILNDIATFSIEQIGNIGIGDVITYNTSDKVCIAGKIDGKNWNVITTTGTPYVDEIYDSTVVSIKRAFNYLDDAIGCDTGTKIPYPTGVVSAQYLGSRDLYTTGNSCNIWCYNDEDVDDKPVYMSGDIEYGWITDYSHSFIVCVPGPAAYSIENSMVMWPYMSNAAQHTTSGIPGNGYRLEVDSPDDAFISDGVFVNLVNLEVGGTCDNGIFIKNHRFFDRYEGTVNYVALTKTVTWASGDKFIGPGFGSQQYFNFNSSSYAIDQVVDSTTIILSTGPVGDLSGASYTVVAPFTVMNPRVRNCIINNTGDYGLRFSGSGGRTTDVINNASCWNNIIYGQVVGNVYFENGCQGAYVYNSTLDHGD